MKKLFPVTFTVLFLFFTLSCEKQKTEIPKLELKTGWKFKTGDDLGYAKADFDDSRWRKIDVDKTWNKQGYEKYEGFAWYRIKVVIPSSLRENALLKDSLIFNLGRIDDFDQVFLNGTFIGENLKNVPRGAVPENSFKDLSHSFWDIDRRYSLASNDTLIHWDGENVIAVRVFDWGVAGGIYSGGLNITTPKYSDYLKIKLSAKSFDDNGEKYGRSVSLENTSSAYTIKGEFDIEVENNISEAEVMETEYSLSLPPRGKKSFSFEFPKPVESTTIYYEFEIEETNEELEKSEGVPYILTPSAGPEPSVNGALVYGERPGKPFLYRIAATGKRPMTFSAENLPEGLILDEKTGIITGSVEKSGKYEVILTAKNEAGESEKTLEIVIGDKLALTPPMGWNSWNCWGLSVTQEKVYAAAKAFVDLGLADHGWTYLNIDDGWEIRGDSPEPKRANDGTIRTNEKFPDMKKLGDDIHALGLKYGIYSSPGELTCGGYTGSYGHEFQDAKTLAEWGIDYLKYDLCGYRNIMKDQNDPAELMPPYELMRDALRGIDRDIVYSICEYGNGKVWEWGEKVGGNLWRTTGDIWDDWNRMYRIGFGHPETARFAGPGHWNDPDMLVLGWVGWGPHLHRTALTPDEQYTHVSLWALLSAPLLLGNDLTRMDDFTMSLITNDEVIAIDQDKLGNQAVPVVREEGIEVWKKKLADGNIAFGIFNVSDESEDFTLKLAELGIKGKITLRDVWRQKDIGIYEKKYEARIPSHGVVLLRTVK